MVFKSRLAFFGAAARCAAIGYATPRKAGRLSVDFHTAADGEQQIMGLSLKGLGQAFDRVSALAAAGAFVRNVAFRRLYARISA